MMTVFILPAIYAYGEDIGESVGGQAERFQRESLTIKEGPEIQKKKPQKVEVADEAPAVLEMDDSATFQLMDIQLTGVQALNAEDFRSFFL